MHWHLDVTFKEDANTTKDKIAAQNLNIINKWCLSILKLFEVGKKKMSLKKKRFCISLDTRKVFSANYGSLIFEKCCVPIFIDYDFSCVGRESNYHDKRMKKM